MQPAQPSRIGMRNQLHRAYRPLYRAKAIPLRRARVPYRAAARLGPGTSFWLRPPNHARLACTLVRRILKFHKSDPFLKAIQN